MNKLILAAVSVAALAISAAPANAAFSYATFSYSSANPVTLSLNGGATTLTATNTGWYTNAGNHDASNPNYIAGICGSSDFCRGDDTIRNDYFVFDLSNVTFPITSAALNILQNPLPDAGYISTSSSITYTSYDVSTDYATLIASHSTSSGIYEDLGSGDIYASTIVPSSSNGTTVVVNLNATGLSALSKAIGGQFKIGGAVIEAVTQPGVPEPATWLSMITGFGLVGGALRRRNTQLQHA